MNCWELVEYLDFLHLSSPTAEFTSRILGHLFHLLYMYGAYIYYISKLLNTAISGLICGADRLALILFEDILIKLTGYCLR